MTSCSFFPGTQGISSLKVYRGLKEIKASWFVLLIPFFLFSCVDAYEESREYPEVFTEEVQDITPEGATFHGRLILRKNPQVEKHGFVWSSTSSVPMLDGLNGTVGISGSPGSDGFSARISAALEKGKNYTVRAYALADGITVYGRPVTFQSLGSEPPFIRDYSPKTGTWGDVISFFGKNFSQVALQNQVRFNDALATVVFASDTILRVLVPRVFNGSEADIRISVTGQSANTLPKFTYAKLDVSIITPLTAKFGDTITVFGSNFNTLPGNTFVFVDATTLLITSVSPGEIKAIIPPALNKRESQVRIRSAGQEVTFPEPFILRHHIISHTDPDTIFKTGEVFTIYGENFTPDMNRTSVFFENNIRANVIESKVDRIKVIIPDGVIKNVNVPEFRYIQFEVRSLNHTATSQVYLHWNAGSGKK